MEQPKSLMQDSPTNLIQPSKASGLQAPVVIPNLHQGNMPLSQLAQFLEGDSSCFSYHKPAG